MKDYHSPVLILAGGVIRASPDSRPGPLALFLRLTMLQFIPLIILPSIVGTTLAVEFGHSFNPLLLVLMLVGVALLHLGANAIDDCYDFQNGVDKTANSMFPKDFAGWKPLPRGLISLKNAKLVSYLLLLGSLSFAVYFFFAVGPWSLILGALGVLLAVVYTAPPLKLDYRGLGLGEVSIFLAFGPIPVLGSYYVQTGVLSATALLASIPIGLLTVTVLIYHDLIFYEVYYVSKKLSLGAILGRDRSLKSSLLLTLVSYALIFSYAAIGIIPVWCVLAPIAGGAILARKMRTFTKPHEPPPYYASLTENGLVANWTFSLVFALTILI